MIKFASILAALAMCALPGVALGQGSGADEYSEDIPGGGGNTPTNDSGNGSNGGGSPLPEGTQEALAEQGSDGAAAANLAEQTGPNGNASTGNQGGGQGGGGEGSGSGLSGDEGSGVSAPQGADSNGSGVASVVGELAGGSDDGMGILLPIILGSVLVAAVAFIFIRRTGGPAGSA